MTLMKRIQGFVLLTGLLLTTALPGQAFAQTAKSIQYGDVVSGELTAATPSFTYTFTAAANDVVVLIMKQDGSDSNVQSMISVNDSKKQAVGDTSKQVTTYSVNMAFTAAANGVYTVVATSTDPTKLGKFKLSLDKAAALTAGKPSKGHATSDKSAYFSYSSGSVFTISYAKQNGDFTPNVNVNKINDDLSLSTLGTIGGSLVRAGSVTLAPTSNQLFIISVEPALFDFNLSTVTDDFTLQADAAK